MLKLALFDFCDTLVSFQSADAFVDYVRRHRSRPGMIFFNHVYIMFNRIRLVAVVNKLFPDASFSKRFKLIQLYGIRREELEIYAEGFYNEEIKSRLIEPVLDHLKKLSSKEYELVLISAGYSIYLNHFAREYNFPHVIATDIRFDSSSNRSKGTLEGRDCIGQEKIRRLKEYFNSDEVDFKNSISYSDSISDLPLLKITGKAFVISENRHQEWTDNFNFYEIIWKKSQ